MEKNNIGFDALKKLEVIEATGFSKDNFEKFKHRISNNPIKNVEFKIKFKICSANVSAKELLSCKNYKTFNYLLIQKLQKQLLTLPESKFKELNSEKTQQLYDFISCKRNCCRRR